MLEFEFKTPINNDAIPLAAMEKVRGIFKDLGHNPSEAHMRGLHQISRAIQAMAFEMDKRPEIVKDYPEFERSFFVSTLPCGMGKTTTLIETVKAVINEDKECRIGFIILLSKLDEIKKLTKDMALAEADYAVITADEEVNRLGNMDRKKARVLFTTQQMLQSRLKDCENFADIKDFHFNGKPRQVRVWDEAIIPSRIHTIEQSLVASIWKDLKKVNLGLGNEIWTFAKALDDVKDGQLVNIPDLSAYEQENLKNVCKYKDDQDTIATLFALSGTTARVYKDNLGATMLRYADIWPKDLAPMLILDASGQQHKTYEYWHKYRDTLKQLPSPQKFYNGLTVHHWDRGSGKDVQKRATYKEIATGIARTINNELPAGKKCLVIHHKQVGYLNLETEVRLQLLGNPEVKFTTWGKHTATNDFSEYEYVILASILQYPAAVYEAYGSSFKNQPLEQALSNAEYEEVRLGEIAQNIMQAACRGTMRKAEGDKCPEGCHLYIIFPGNAVGGGRGMMGRIFPHSIYTEWLPVRKLQGKVAQKIAKAIKDTGHGNYISKRLLMRDNKIIRPARLDEILAGSVIPYLEIEESTRLSFYGDQIKVELIPTKNLPF